MFKSVATVTAIVLAASAQASLLVPGFNNFPVAGEVGPLGGTIIASQTQPFASAAFSGTVYGAVISGDVTNPFIGGLTFVYIVHNNAASTNGIHRFTHNGYAGFLTDASYEVPAAGLIPTNVDRTSIPADGGDVIGWDFPVFSPFGQILPGMTTSTLVVQTNATNWQFNIGHVIDGATADMNVYSPAIPTPGCAGLLGLGLMAANRRRR